MPSIDWSLPREFCVLQGQSSDEEYYFPLLVFPFNNFQNPLVQTFSIRSLGTVDGSL